MDTSIKSIAVIGGGPSGLVAAKSAIEEGFAATIFEKNKGLGGLWHPDFGATWDSMRTNLSKYSCMFSDYPWKEGTEMFPSRHQMYQYLCSYAEAFHLSQHIQFCSEVVHLKHQEQDGKWRLLVRKEDEKINHLFDHVIICSGFFSKPAYPEIDRTLFDGRVIHGSQYRSALAQNLEGQHICVIGGSFTGTEIAADLSHHAAKVSHVSTRSFWLLSRFLPKDSSQPKEHLPLDLLFYQRSPSSEEAVSLKEKYKKSNLWFSSICEEQQQVAEIKVSEAQYQDPPFVVISDTYLQQVKAKKIKVIKDRLKSFDGFDLILKSDKRVEKVDVVIFCTGYFTQLPFFDEETLDSIQYQPRSQFHPLPLYQATFHPALQNLAFVGMYRGPYFAIMELQARWVCMAFKEPDKYYPSAEKAQSGIDEECEKFQQRDLALQFPYDFITLADTIANIIGVYPKDDEVHRAPVVPAQFRINGPHENGRTAKPVIDECNDLITKK